MADIETPKPKKQKTPSGETTPQKQMPAELEANKWKPGQTGNPLGRPKGSRNKLGEAFLEAMHADFTEHGPDVITRVRNEKPEAYLKVVASILPQQLNVRVSEYDELTDDQIDKRIDALARALKLEIGTGKADGGERPPEERKSLN